MSRRETYKNRVAKALVLVLTALTLLQPFQKDFITAGFYLNRDFIAANYCENLEHPELHCEGICQLKKSLKNAADQDQEETIQRLQTEIQFLVNHDFVLKTVYPRAQTDSFPVFDAARPADPMLSAIFKPPVFA